MICVGLVLDHDAKCLLGMHHPKGNAESASRKLTALETMRVPSKRFRALTVMTASFKGVETHESWPNTIFSTTKSFRGAHGAYRLYTIA